VIFLRICSAVRSYSGGFLEALKSDSMEGNQYIEDKRRFCDE